MASWADGTVHLWAGWSLRLPNPCRVQTAPDGSWSAWDESHSIDVQIIEVGGRAGGGTIAPEDMLGEAATVLGPGWIGVVEQIMETDEHRDVFRYALTAAATDTVMSCWIAFRDPSGRAWARAVQAGVVHAG